MPEQPALSPADPDDLRQALAFALTFDGRKQFRNADEIVGLEAGRVVQRGTHEELLQTSGLYRRLYDLQFRDEEPATAEV